MTAQAIKQDPQKAKSANPAERLNTLLADDMAKVNETILDRLHSDVPLIPQIASYLIAAGGKRIRPLLTLAATRLYGDTGPRPYALAASVEFIHTATLLHDDVVDESEQRRGQDSAPKVFGNQSSVLVGDFLFSRAFQLMVEDGSLEILRILSTASAVIAEGEVMQLTTAGNLATTMEEYNKVIGAKTAALFAAATEIGPVIAGADKAAQQAMRDYGYYLGLAFQVADDVLDYAADQSKLGKNVGDDFREGKVTAPLIIALQNASAQECDFWTRTIEKKDQREGDLARATEIFKAHNALEAGLALADRYAARALKALENAPESPLKPILADLVAYTVRRDH